MDPDVFAALCITDTRLHTDMPAHTPLHIQIKSGYLLLFALFLANSFRKIVNCSILHGKCYTGRVKGSF